MKWLTLVLLLIQEDCLFSCIFDKVEAIRGKSAGTFSCDLNECFAGCYENKNCTAIRFYTKGNVCALYGVGDYLLESNEQYVCYVLQRDEVDSSCKTYVNF
ncbi:unnamed protein product [Cylicocyclus nassatus]|uniref:Apple domain-containing protein n=1 Tax=Cylicocyclus nassatus TaxID=53992 RepID=A0AA36M5N8_CYLNA|nr:unnamed protein product [Cylicocyclus nassatus]